MDSWKRQWGVMVIVGLIALLVLQIASGLYVQQRSRQLHATLDQASTRSLELTRSLGYGGLIHHFKNQVLRPSETTYSALADASAKRAALMLRGLEDNARQLHVNASLDATRSMISAYVERLERLPALIDQGLRPGEIDPLVRFDDSEALTEIELLLGQIRRAVHGQVKAVSSLGNTLFWLSSTAMALLVVFLLKELLRRKRDLKAIEQLNDELSESVKRLGESNIALKQFAGIVSHDLKAPLRHIGFFGTLISEDMENANADEVKKHVNSIDSAIDRMDNLIESLLDFTKTGFTEPRLAPVELKQVASDAIQELEPLIEQSGAQVSLSLAGTINADAMLLSRVFQNLVGNSIKYARQGVTPHIEIRSSLDDQFAHISFTDNGIGVPAKYAERIFEPFERLHGSKGNYKGSGIGLALVKTVVEAHDGSIKLDTDHTDGTRIVVSLMKNPVLAEQSNIDSSESVTG